MLDAEGRVAQVLELEVREDPREQAARRGEHVVRRSGRVLHLGVQLVHLGPLDAAKAAVAERRQDHRREGMSIVAGRARLEPCVDMQPDEPLGELADRDDLRRPRFWLYHTGALTSHRLAGRRVVALVDHDTGEHHRGTPTRLVNRERRAEQTDPLAVTSSCGP